MDEIIISALTGLGLLFLIYSIRKSYQIMLLLNDNIYPYRTWFVIIIMLIGFIVGYTGLILHVTGVFPSPVALELIVAFIYFFGSVFTVITTRIVSHNLTGILGQRLDDETALTMFRTYAGLTQEQVTKEGLNLLIGYEIDCDICQQKVSYNIPQIVKSNAVALDRGIAVEDIFGTKSYIFRPSHHCIQGRREITVVHDKNLEIRSIEGSRLIYGGQVS